MDAKELMKGAMDIHIHIGPDPNRRRRVDGYDAALQAKAAGMRGVVFDDDMTLATGHLSTREIFALLASAKKKRLERILITHPLARWVGPTISIEDQKKMARPGVYIEMMLLLGIEEGEIITMVKTNPAMALGLPAHV